MSDAERACPYCAEPIKAAAIKCRWCGSMLAEDHEPPLDEPVSLAPGQQLYAAMVRRDTARWVSGEIVIASLISGVAAGSWWVGGGTLIALLVLMNIPPVAMLLGGLLWGAGGWLVGGLFESWGARVMLALIAGFAGWGVHWSAAGGGLEAHAARPRRIRRRRR